MYRTRDNLVSSFITEDQLIATKPVDWWNRGHDVDLLYGTYRHGFGKYDAIREDRSLNFYDTGLQIDNGELEKGFPPPENLTKRYKKLILVSLRY